MSSRAALSQAGSQIMSRSQSMQNFQVKTVNHGPKGLTLETSPDRNIGNQLHSTTNLHKVTVTDMVKMTMKNNDIFGIQGYNLPRQEPYNGGNKNCFPKAKLKNFAEVEASLTKAVPGPGEYKVVPKWGQIEKKVNPTKKNTYIEQIVKQEGIKPSPATYKLEFKLVTGRTVGGSKTTNQGVNFLSDTEFQSMNIPAPAQKDMNPDVAKIKTLGRCTSVVSFKHEKATDKEWKTKKTELPGPGSHPVTDKALSLTLQSSPVVKFKTGKRIIFAEAISKQKSFVPSPSAYTFKDFKEDKIWKRLTNKRQ